MTNNQNSNNENPDNPVSPKDTPSSDSVSYPNGGHPNGDPSPSRPLPESEQSARYRWVYDDLCQYCNDMWTNITAIRNRALEQSVFSGSFLGLLLAIDTAFESYATRWWGFASIMTLVAVTLPHLRLVVGVVKSTEYRMNTKNIKEPNWELPEQIIAAKEEKASILQKQSEKITRRYISARRYWLIGVVAWAALGVLEWFL